MAVQKWTAFFYCLNHDFRKACTERSECIFKIINIFLCVLRKILCVSCVKK